MVVVGVTSGYDLRRDELCGAGVRVKRHTATWIKPQSASLKLKSGEASASYIFYTTPGKNLTFQFAPNTSIAHEKCHLINEETAKIYVELYQKELRPFCEGRIPDYPLVSGDRITITICNKEKPLEAIIVPKLAGNVLSETHAKSSRVRRSNQLEWVQIRRSHQQSKLRLAISNLYLFSRLCDISYIRLQVYKQDGTVENYARLCRDDEDEEKTFVFEYDVASVKMTFQTAEFEFEHRLVETRWIVDSRNFEVITDKKDERAGMSGAVYAGVVIAFVALVCFIAFVAITMKRRRRNNLRQADTNGEASSFDNDDDDDDVFNQVATTRLPMPLPKQKGAGSYDQVPIEDSCHGDDSVDYHDYATIPDRFNRSKQQQQQSSLAVKQQLDLDEYAFVVKPSNRSPPQLSMMTTAAHYDQPRSSDVTGYDAPRAQHHYDLVCDS